MGVTGVVKKFHKDRGFGFIQRDDGGKDVFVHVQQVKASKVQGQLKDGDKLDFEIQEGERGPRAANISRVAL
jgi:cold shock protein